MKLTPGELYIILWLDHCQYTSNEIYDPSLGNPPVQVSLGRYLRRSPKVHLFETTWCQEQRITSSDILALLTRDILSVTKLVPSGKEIRHASSRRGK